MPWIRHDGISTRERRLPAPRSTGGDQTSASRGGFVHHPIRCAPQTGFAILGYRAATCRNGKRDGGTETVSRPEPAGISHRASNALGPPGVTKAAAGARRRGKGPAFTIDAPLDLRSQLGHDGDADG